MSLRSPATPSFDPLAMPVRLADKHTGVSTLGLLLRLVLLAGVVYVGVTGMYLSHVGLGGLGVEARAGVVAGAVVVVVWYVTGGR